jgi:hypothetical protein
MGTALSRIEKEFILMNLIEKRAPVELRCRSQRIACTISEMSRDMMVVEAGDSLPDYIKKTVPVEAFFNFKGKRMTFKSLVDGLEDRKVTLTIPEGIYRDLSRKFERISNPEDVTISFWVQGRKFDLSFPKAENAEVPEEEPAANGFDPSRIADLLRAFREKAREFASENKIVMFRERKPESIEEKIVAKTGRILVYPQSFGGDKDVSLLSPKVLAQEEVVIAQTKEGEELFQVLADISAINVEKEKKGIVQDMYCPILYQEYVAGYLYLVSFKDAPAKFGQKVVDYVLQFSRLLSYALKVNGYFKAEPVREKLDKIELIDMSASGLLFCLDIEEFQDVFTLYQDLDITIHMKDREIAAVGRIMRKFNDKGRIYIALHFFQMEDEAKTFLIEYLYGANLADIIEKEEDWTL